MTIGDRKIAPEIFQDTLDSTFETYDEWLDRVLRKTLTMLTRSGIPVDRGGPDNRAVEETLREAGNVLEFEISAGLPLHGAVPQQMYEDVFVRLLSMMPNGPGPIRNVHPYAEFNALCHRLGLILMATMADAGILGDGTADIPRLIQTAVLSGYVGINLKSSASAASDLLNRNLISIDPGWVGSMAKVRAVSRQALSAVARELIDLTSSALGRFALDSLDMYFREVVETDQPTLVVFFCDDYLESMIDLKRFEAMLRGNRRLILLFVPRNGRYGNDLAVQDIPAVLAEKPYAGVCDLLRNGRIAISGNGPRAGCIDPRSVSDALIDEIDCLGAGRRIILETKGCRNFEMLRGDLPMPWYAAFNCNRALSIRTVQVDGSPVFLRIPPGLNAYDGFMMPRIGRSPSYGTAGVRFARMTTRALYDVLCGDTYRRMLGRLGDEYALNRRLAAYCRRVRKPLPEAIASYAETEWIHGQGK
ncbi:MULTISPECIES: hypothetical protein [Desulfococcus]|uniref:Damage-control phosphatase ARMT1-like metal-binding domain-containing protein n=1 Tax=Desulfococcus multivorans DSM 2059 TaxID=1121405 RepID=S7UUU3_DESML|nr:hypothetical protein [Desulfococcus multivorans]EPR37849.1 hypothetical protein dsmv_2889 [Desulfococcus multivorans DSM 2059]SKA16640.1 hypothetical protein SAMN02745446_03064 [Desulfococcus multivorans DSM 2059]